MNLIHESDQRPPNSITEEFLHLIDETTHSVAIIDTIHAVTLMGGQTTITGLNPDISQTSVQFGIGFDVDTRSSLQNGLKTALVVMETNDGPD